jgi:protein-S-isoprenylcysteine O-methyltransferase Ste14
MKNMNANDIERAERMSRGRAAIMALAALVLVINLVLQYGNPAYVGADPRGASWLVVIGLWLFILWNGGGLRLKGNMRALLNDELSLQNRARALSTGFYVAVLGALVLYAIEWRVPVGAGDALKIVSAGALAAALLRYAWLEWR